MSKLKYILLLIILIVFLEPTTIISEPLEAPSRTLFTIEKINSGKMIFLNVEHPINVDFDINVTNLNVKVIFSYYEYNLGNSDNSIEKRFNLIENQSYNFKIYASYIRIQLIDEENYYTNSSASGFYRFNVYNNTIPENIIWKPFTLTLINQKFLEIFPASGGINNLTIDIEIIEIFGGHVNLIYASSDFYQSEIITELGNYSFLIETNFVQLDLYGETNYSRVFGYYTIIDHGQIHKYSAHGFSFIAFIISIFLATLKLNNKKDN